MNPFPAWVERVWDAWVIRVLVLWSLSLQIMLVLLGSRRKQSRRIWMRIMVWCAYLMADWVAAVALGKLSNVPMNADPCHSNNVSDNPLMALWAPLLLLHLGGPDTITAYSVEDVHLWLRHLFDVVLNVALVIYVFLRFWTGDSNLLSFLTIPMFIAGAIKYAERTWVLGNTNSVFPHPLLPIRFDNQLGLRGGSDDQKLLVSSYLWLQALGPCLAGSGDFDRRLVRLDRHQVESVSTSFDDDQVESGSTSFRFCEFQLSFLYDTLYTKASIIYTTAGCIIRSISLICVVGVLVGFAVIVNADVKYSNMEVWFTCVLLVGAVVLEVYGVALVISSDWAIVWMCKHMRKVPPLVPMRRSSVRSAICVGQLNILRMSLICEKKPILYSILNLIGMDVKCKAFMCTSYVSGEHVKDLKDFILKQVKVKQIFFRNCGLNKIFPDGAKDAIKGCSGHLVTSLEKGFEVSIIVWHIATSYCYELDGKKDDSQKRSRCKIMSDYMMYLLVNHPKILADIQGSDLGVVLGYYYGHDRVKITKAMLDWEPKICTSDSARNIFGKEREYATIPVDARDVAKTLMGDDYKDKKWEVICQVWLAMLCHGAANSQWVNHLHPLRQGGEFLTQLRLLLTVHSFLNSPDTGSTDQTRY